MNEISSSPRGPGPAKGFLRQYGSYMIGGALVVGIAAVPLEAVVSNNRAEYEATGDVGALLGHPFDRSTHAAYRSADYAALVAQHPDLKFSPDDSPEIRSIKIGAINAKLKAKLEGEIEASQIIPRTQETAAAQAKAQMLVQAQANVDVMEDAADSETRAEAAVLTHLSDSGLSIKSGIQAKAIDRQNKIYMEHELDLTQDWSLWTKSSPHGYFSLQEKHPELAKEISADSVVIGPGTFYPFLDPNGKAAWTTDSHGEKFVAGVVDDNGYFIPAADYLQLGGPPLAPAYKYKQL